MKSTFWTIAGKYRVRTDDDATFDLLAGARLADLNQSLDWEFVGDFGTLTPPPRTGNRDASVEQWDAIVGAKGRVALGAEQRWVMPWYVDIGTGDSDLTWQAVLGLGYAFDWGQLTVTWTMLEYELSDGAHRRAEFQRPIGRGDVPLVDTEGTAGSKWPGLRLRKGRNHVLPADNSLASRSLPPSC